MAIKILAPAPPVEDFSENDSDSSDDGGVDLDGDFDMRPRKRVRHDDDLEVVTPGDIITDDPDWMRCVCSRVLIWTH